jgi:FecR protein
MLIRLTLFILALAVTGLASAEPPERIARLSYVEGQIKFQGEQEVAPSALPDRPLASGDRLATERDGRAELALGSATLRLDESTAVTVADLDASTVRLELAAGAASLHLYELLESETFEVVTLNTTIAFREPGEYRVDITPSGATELSVRAGNAEVATAGGPVRVADGQRVRLEGRAEIASLVTPRAADAFDEWVLEREVQLAESAPDESSDAYGEETLDDYGEWADDPSYGQVWMPSYAYGGYDPFSYGYWQQSGLGWSWYDPMPWSAYTFHHGQWYLNDQNRWAWVAQRRELQRRAYRRDEQLERALGDSSPQSGQRDTRPVGRPNADELERRAEATSSGLGRRIDAERRSPILQRTVESANASRNAAAPPAKASAAPDSSTSTVRPARAASSSRQSTSRPAATTTKGAFANPQEP